MLSLIEYIKSQSDFVLESLSYLLADRSFAGRTPMARYTAAVLGHKAEIIVRLNTSDGAAVFEVCGPQHDVRGEFVKVEDAINFWRTKAVPNLEDHVRGLLAEASSRGLDVLGVAAEALAQDVVSS